MSYATWAKNRSDISSGSGQFSAYQAYVTDWANQRTSDKESPTDVKKEAYKKLLAEVFLDFATPYERNILQNLNLDNPIEAEIAIPFIVKKISNMVEYYKRKRHEIRYMPTHVDITGSALGIEKTIFNTIVEHIRTNESDFVAKLEEIKQSFNVEIVEYFDMHTGYFDKAPADNTSTFGVKLDNTLYSNFDSTLLALIKEYPMVLTGLKEPLIDISGETKTIDLSKLEHKDYADTNSGDTVLSLKKDFISKFLGADVYYLKKGTDGVELGVLARAESPYTNTLNIKNATVALRPSSDELVSTKHVGIFTPSIQGLIFYRASAHTFEIDEASMVDGVTYVFPDPHKYGNVVGLSGDSSYEVPIIHHSSNADFFRGIEENSFVFNKIKNETTDTLTFAYVSKEQKQNRQPRSIDENISPINKVVDSPVTDYQEDIYGNRYYRSTPSFRNIITKLKSGTISKTDQIAYNNTQMIMFNGGSFTEPLSSTEFDYDLEQTLTLQDMILQRMGWGEPTALGFTDTESDIFLAFGSFADVRLDDTPSFAITYYDCGIVDPTVPNPLVDDVDFPLDNINYPFDIAIDGSVHQYLGNGEYIRADAEHPSDTAETIPLEYGLKILEGNPLDAEDSGEPDIKVNAFIIDPLESSKTVIVAPEYTDGVHTIAATREALGIHNYFVVPVGSTERVSLSSFFSKIFGKYSTSLNEQLKDAAAEADVKKLSILNDVAVINFGAFTTFEKLVYNNVMTSDTLSDSYIEEGDYKVSTPVFARKKKRVFVSKIKYNTDATAIMMTIHSFDAVDGALSVFYTSPSDETFAINPAEYEEAITVDATVLDRPTISVNETKNIITVAFTIVDVFKVSYFVVAKFDISAENPVLESVEMTVPDATTANFDTGNINFDSNWN